MIHERLRRARRLRGLSLDALAQRLGDISKQALNKFETGLAIPNSTRLLQLAEALEVKPEYFFRAETVQLAPLEFRKLAKMPKGDQVKILEMIQDHVERYDALERCFDAADLATNCVQTAQFSVSSPDGAEKAAQDLRLAWDVGSDPIANLTELLESRGIKVAQLDGPDDFDGACAVSRDQRHVLVALNATKPGERMRFTAAHELGHWVMALSSTLSERDQEACCHRFAGAFLYPKARVLADFGHHPRHHVHPVELLNAKRRYGLSMQAVLRRLKDVGLLAESGYRSAMIKASKLGWRRSEPEPLPAEQPRRFVSMVYWALAEDLVTPSRAAEFLQCSVSELNSGEFMAVAAA